MAKRDDARKKAQLSSPKSIPSVAITAATAQKGNIGVYLDAIGTVTPVYTSSITPQANGIVTAVSYTEGQMVQKGDPLIEIDPRPYQAQLAEAQGTLEHDTNVLAQARMDLERFRAAWARNAIPKQTLDDQEKLVLQLQGTVKFDVGAVAFAEIQLGYCHITAPIPGRVGLRLVDPGNVVQANQTSATTSALVIITQIQPITVIFTIAEDSIDAVQAQIRKGAVLPVEAFNRTEAVKIDTGKLLTLDNQIDTTTGTVKLRALFDNKDQALFPNEFVNARLLVKTLKGVTLIPTNAIQHNGQETFVYLVRNGTAVMQTIKAGVADAGMTAVEGINPGDVVATSSFNKLQNGSKVAISTQPIPSETSGSKTGSNAP
ncbi:MAG: putative Co/Zn/Cd efflux system rane fusion protein [Bryobacterales bacterium]|nr:putative Co/Zn/Cd efflux system rane fusion protein [Bryobacterales bacterium]